MPVSEELVARFKELLPRLSRADKIRCYRILKEQRIERARVDPAFFVEYAIPHEKTRRPVRNEQFHKDWHKFFSESRFGLIVASVEHGKTASIAIGRSLWELGKDPTLRMAIISATDKATVKVGRAIRRHIDRNPLVQEVFPGLRRSDLKGEPWTINDMVVAGSGGSAKDPSLQCRSVGAGDILGSRLDLAIIDDILSIRNTRTKIGRDNLEEWFEDTVITRIFDDIDSGKWGRIFFIGNPWDSDDEIARLSSLPGWRTMTTPAVLNPDESPDRWVPTWPAAWTRERLLAKRDTMHPHTFARKYLCRVLDSSSRRFLRAWLDHALALGIGRSLLERQPHANGRPLRCFTGCDPGFGKKDADAKSVLSTLAVDHQRRRILVNLRSGRWTGPELLRQAQEVTEAFDSELYVEGNAAQRWLAEFGQEAGIMARAVNTGSEKWDDELGVEGLAVLMKNGFFVLPSGPDGHTVDPEVSELIREMYDFDPAAHSGDRLMATWVCDKAVREYLAPRFVSDSSHSDR
jgi:hypothetical protein